MLMRMTEKEKLMMQERGDDYRSTFLSGQKWERAQRIGSSAPMKETALNKSGTTYMIYFLFYHLSQH